MNIQNSESKEQQAGRHYKKGMSTAFGTPAVIINDTTVKHYTDGMRRYNADPIASIQERYKVLRKKLLKKRVLKEDIVLLDYYTDAIIEALTTVRNSRHSIEFIASRAGVSVKEKIQI
jgi:hypothetical protein